ncbi:MAG: class I SAM-dependent methyltransferase [Candidatus Staskawiczbacteria bacterium]|nr:class I SAM-dependent methyltransferase [Candidatus Staskawiczbacteria bacterium]
MGIALNLAYLISRTLKTTENSNKKILTIGVQDCYFDSNKLLTLFNKKNIPHKNIESEDIELTTGFRHLSEEGRKNFLKNIHQRTFFEYLGFARKNITSLDVSNYECCDIEHDLNYPISEELHNRYDVVFDSGSIEHIISIKDVFFNMAKMLKIGGLVIQFAPVDMINHGFINLNACIFNDFYTLNGFERVDLRYIGIPFSDEDSHFLEIDPFIIREPLRAPYSLAVFSAYIKLENKNLKVPIQSFYHELLNGEISSEIVTLDSLSESAFNDKDEGKLVFFPQWVKTKFSSFCHNKSRDPKGEAKRGGIFDDAVHIPHLKVDLI